MTNMNDLLEILENEYPKNISGEFISANYGRPMKITLKSNVVFGTLWFRWEHQNDADLQDEILCFNSGNREIDKLKLKFNDIKSVEWD